MINVSCSRTQPSNAGEAQTSKPSVSSQARDITEPLRSLVSSIISSNRSKVTTFSQHKEPTTYFQLFLHYPILYSYSRTRLKTPLRKKTKSCFSSQLWLNAGQKYCRMLKESILQYFRPSLSYHLSFCPLFCLFLSACGRLRQVLLYIILSTCLSFKLIY